MLILDYKNILTKRYALDLSLKEIADEFGTSKSGVENFFKGFEDCEKTRIHYQQELQFLLSERLFIVTSLAKTGRVSRMNSRTLNTRNNDPIQKLRGTVHGRQ